MNTFERLTKMCFFKYVVFAIFAIAVSACSSSKYSDLDKYVADVKKRTKGSIKPLPEITPPPSITYDAAELRDPFTPYADEPKEEHAPPGLTPDANRTREALEVFPLDSLSFVGTLQKDSNFWGLVQAPDDSIHRVSVGNYMGKNYGEILSITESTIVLKEIVSNGQGGFIEREASLALTE